MEITKQNLENLRKDSFMRHVSSLFDVDLNKLIDEAEAELGKNDEKLNKTNMEHDMKTIVDKKKYAAPISEQSRNFVMSLEQFENFVNNYRQLIEAQRKVEYLYGITFTDGNKFSFTSKISEIIWNFIRIIFGDDNAEDIADFIYGNSNFDSAKALYEELV